MQPGDGKIIDEYQYENKHLLGKGSFGTVYKGVDTKRNRPIAVKVIPSAMFENNQDQLKMLKQEIGNMMKISQESEHIVKLYDVKRSKSNLYMILEFCEDGSLEDYIKKNKNRISEQETLKIISQVLKGFQVLHRHHISHRDLKLPNVLIHKGVVKVADFGFSKMNEGQSLMTSLVGSPLYTAPQILLGMRYSDKCDIWSIGVMMFEMIYGTFPWLASTPPDLARKIKNTPLRIPDSPPTSPEFKQLLAKLLVLDEAVRISWEELFNYPLFDDSQERKQRELLEREPDNLRKSIGLLGLQAQRNLQVYDAAEIRRLNSGESTNRTEETKDDDNNRPATFHQDVADEIRRNEILKVDFKRYGNRIAFERNLLKFMTRYFIYELYVYANNLNMRPDLYYRLMFIVGKHYMIIVTKLKETLETKANTFNFPNWDKYCLTKDYQDFLAGIKQEYTSFYEFFKSFYLKTREYFTANPNSVEPRKMAEFNSILNETFREDPIFKSQMKETFRDFFVFVKTVWQSHCNDKKFLLLLDFMLTVQNGIYSEFPLDENYRFDMYKFIEDREARDINVTRGTVFERMNAATA
eukprot:TRINITY_DN963_c0_g1_i15.p1 TRINITY_DN963_c0_g1~~TRINITY_DN963_c0_g1_i15.p1  ORF type:complete len:581 (+),score=153.06 TRINITY_DN963_c0_g1_i15:75-1817(+)